MRNKRSGVKGKRGWRKTKDVMGETYAEDDQEKRAGLAVGK